MQYPWYQCTLFKDTNQCNYIIERGDILVHRKLLRIIVTKMATTQLEFDFWKQEISNDAYSGVQM